MTLSRHTCTATASKSATSGTDLVGMDRVVITATLQNAHVLSVQSFLKILCLRNGFVLSSFENASSKLKQRALYFSKRSRVSSMIMQRPRQFDRRSFSMKRTRKKRRGQALCISRVIPQLFQASMSDTERLTQAQSQINSSNKANCNTGGNSIHRENHKTCRTERGCPV